MPNDFDEVVFPTKISLGAIGGPGFSTSVSISDSGFEQRNSTWAQSRAEYDVAHGLKDQADLDALLAFFYARKARARGFLFRDHSDFKVVQTNSVLVPLTGSTFQCYKRYSSGAVNHDRKITKIQSGTFVAYDSGTPNPLWTVDITTGIVTNGGGNATAFECNFYVPVRFDTDSMRVSIVHYNYYDWRQIPIVEVRI